MVNLTSALLVAATASAAAIDRRSTSAKSPSYTPPVTSNNTFGIITLAYKGDLRLSGYFPEAIHSGAGLNMLTAVPLDDGPGSLSFNSTTGDIYFILGGDYPYPYSIGFDGNPSDEIVQDSWPAGYSFMGMNHGWRNAGFSFDDRTNVVDRKSYQGKSLAVCPMWWDNQPSGRELVHGLMWRAEGTKRNSSCADVELKALAG